MTIKKFIKITLSMLFILFTLSNPIFCEEINSQPIKFPDYSQIYIGKDKYETFNRKMFDFNLRLNKYALRPIHILWASIMPKYGMDRISNITKNIEFPIRFVSTLLQRDFNATKNESIRFITNSTLGLGGMFDAAKHIFKLEPVQENMEQALAKCHVKSGCYLVMPVINSTTPRDILGRILDTMLNPSSYIATPAIAVIKAAIMVNRTYFMQPIIQMLETTYADPYDISKKMYGLENYIKCANLDRINLISNWVNKINPVSNKKTNIQENTNVNSNIVETGLASNINNEFYTTDILQGRADETNILLKDHIKKYDLENIKLTPDIILENYNPQTPVIDSMRTALLNIDGMDSKIWADFSLWNRGFYKRLKTSSINLTQGKTNYKYRYLVQKTKNSPIAVIYPSIGESIMSTHSAMLAKLFYDKGFSVLILGSHFQWEFVKSMPDNYYPGLPEQDCNYLKLATDKIITSLETKYNCKFKNKTTIGTSFGAMMCLYMGQKEFNPNDETQNNKYIAICPPIDLFYAMQQIDKNTEEWDKNPNNLKEKVAITATKIIQLYNTKKDFQNCTLTLPFNDEEAKLITGFILHQKLSDLIYTLENASKLTSNNIYSKINNMNYFDYVNKYIANYGNKNINDIIKNSNIKNISDYLINANNYKIYHSLDDYLTNTKQLHQLKLYTGTKTILFNNGAHLGFLYRQEFLNELNKEISN